MWTAIFHPGVLIEQVIAPESAFKNEKFGFFYSSVLKIMSAGSIVEIFHSALDRGRTLQNWPKIRLR